ncbi:MAG: Asp-tRNA(Asn)/Glu-tRNA(Gln) amidotransferase subunit GatC [Bacilli bacterium]
MIEKEKLEDYAKKLMFKMNDEEYETLQNEFETILKQIYLINKIEGIKEVEPMSFPFVTYQTSLRNDVVEESLEIDDVLKNASSSYCDQVKVPKVVE